MFEVSVVYWKVAQSLNRNYPEQRLNVYKVLLL